ncbi:MAG: hypothetical protein GX670_11410 [Bacteroidales bacterium]|nr:hypothetical protein [Bacteroidales bacterium]
MKKIIYFLAFVALAMFASCEQETNNSSLPDFQNTTNVNITGKWEVTAHNESIPVFGPFTLLTVTNPESENDSITILDSEVKFWKFQVKAAVNEIDGTFETNLSNCEVSEEGIGIKIANGKIVDTDSIYFEIQFEDDETPYGNTYHLKGHRVKG